LDEGQATAGGVITPYYDSLLVKVTAHAFDIEAAANDRELPFHPSRARGTAGGDSRKRAVEHWRSATNRDISSPALSHVPAEPPRIRPDTLRSGPDGR
jgi:hypothetical protein